MKSQWIGLALAAILWCANPAAAEVQSIVIDGQACTITLTAPAPSGGTSFMLSNPGFSGRIPMRVTVPAGQDHVTFRVEGVSSVTATCGGESYTGYPRQNAPAIVYRYYPFPYYDYQYEPPVIPCRPDDGSIAPAPIPTF